MEPPTKKPRLNPRETKPAGAQLIDYTPDLEKLLQCVRISLGLDPPTLVYLATCAAIKNRPIGNLSIGKITVAKLLPCLTHIAYVGAINQGYNTTYEVGWPVRRPSWYPHYSGSNEVLVCTTKILPTKPKVGLSNDSHKLRWVVVSFHPFGIRHETWILSFSETRVMIKKHSIEERSVDTKDFDVLYLPYYPKPLVETDGCSDRWIAPRFPELEGVKNPVHREVIAFFWRNRKIRPCGYYFSDIKSNVPSLRDGSEQYAEAVLSEMRTNSILTKYWHHRNQESALYVLKCSLRQQMQ